MAPEREGPKSPREIAAERSEWQPEQWKKVVSIVRPDLVSLAWKVHSRNLDFRYQMVQQLEEVIDQYGYEVTMDQQVTCALVYLSDEGWNTFWKAYWENPRLTDRPRASETFWRCRKRKK